MNRMDLYSPFSPDMKQWMFDQLVLERPRAEIVADFIERYPGFGKKNGQAQPFEVLDKRLRSVIKNMMRGKVGDEIHRCRRRNREESSLTLADRDYRDRNRQEIWTEKRAILAKLDDETLSSAQERKLMKKLSVLDSLRRDIDAAERSENRQSSNGNNSFFNNLPDPSDFTPIEEFPSRAGPAPPAKLPPTKTPKEPEPTEPEWYEIDDAEHITV